MKEKKISLRGMRGLGSIDLIELILNKEKEFTLIIEKNALIIEQNKILMEENNKKSKEIILLKSKILLLEKNIIIEKDEEIIKLKKILNKNFILY